MVRSSSFVALVTVTASPSSSLVSTGQTTAAATSRPFQIVLLGYFVSEVILYIVHSNTCFKKIKIISRKIVIAHTVFFFSLSVGPR